MNSRGNVDSEGPSTLSQMEFRNVDLEFIDKSVAQFKAMQEHLQSMPVFEEYLPQGINFNYLNFKFIVFCFENFFSFLKIINVTFSV